MTLIKDLQDGSNIEGIYLVKFKAVFTGKTGKPYLNMVLIDRTGEVAGKVWDSVQELSDLFAQNDFVKIRGRVSSYQSRLQLVVTQLRRLDESEVDIADFLPVSDKNIEDMFSELKMHAAEIGDGHLKQLCLAVLNDAEIAEKLKRAPAAKGMHHVYVGGVLEHSLSVLNLSTAVIDHYHKEGYKEINRSLVVAGAILHDLGKLWELSYERSFDYTDEGRLIGHITIGVEMVVDFIRDIPDFPRRLEMLLKHMLLSHHGLYEYGSPKRPKTLEAMILHYLDDLDSKINSISNQISRDSELEGNWTTYHRLYDRFIYKEHYPETAGEAPTNTSERVEQRRPGRRDDSAAPNKDDGSGNSSQGGSQGQLGFL
jgi:3'-5' exoribonuclease